MDEVYLLVGSNLGDRKYYLDFTLSEIKIAGRILQVSSVYESVPWGYESENCFLNQCVKLRTGFSPQRLLKLLKDIENRAGRIYKGGSYQDRSLDVDILFYGSKVIQTDKLIVPHPRLHLRAFALVPLAEIAADFLHPLLHKEVRELLDECEDKNWPVKFSGS